MNRYLVTIQIVKNGYLVSFPRIEQSNPNSSELSNFVPMTEVSQMRIPREDSIIVTDEEEIIRLLREIRATIR